jgi:hypothetical protein
MWALASRGIDSVCNEMRCDFTIKEPKGNQSIGLYIRVYVTYAIRVESEIELRLGVRGWKTSDEGEIT